MARIRTIKPEFFTSADVVALSPLARLLFIGLWGVADREGRFKWRPADFKLQVLPGDQCDVEVLCRELIERHLVIRYGDGLAYIPTFKDHQSINPRESASKLPDPDDIHFRFDASNLDLHPQRGKEGKGKEGNDSEANASGADAPSEDPVKVLFDEGVKLLTDHDCKPSSARSIIAKWRKEQGDDATRDALNAFRQSSSTEPISWVSHRFANALQGGVSRETFDQRRIREGLAVINAYEAPNDRH
jgi:hypothetical protein